MNIASVCVYEGETTYRLPERKKVLVFFIYF